MIYYVPTKIYFGIGALNKLENIVNQYNPNKIFLLTGKNFVKNSGLQNRVLDMLKKYNIIVYDKVNPVPQLYGVKDALIKAKENEVDFVIGIGGGSVLDTSKIVSVMLTNQGNIIDYVNNKKIKNKGVTLIAIPTTAGTGSEVTPFAAFYYEKKKQSFGSIEDYLIYPSYAIVDPELTFTMSEELTASTGLDALSQAIESYWSINSTPLSDTHAIEAIRLIFNNLENAYLNGNDINFRFNMSKASLEAGLAFSQTATTAPHAVSYPMTAHFNVPHGFACALTLPEFFLYNYDINKNDCLDKRGPDYVKEKLEDLAYNIYHSKIKGFYSRIKKLMENLDAPLTLSEAGINNFDIIINEGFAPERMNNNPKLVTKESLKEILEKIR